MRRAQQAVSADQSALNAAIDRRLKQVPVDQIPALGPYAFLVSKIQRNAKHTLSPDQESYRHSVTLPHEQAMADAHDRIDQSLRSIGSKEDLSSLDLATRRTALKARNDAYNAAAPTLATLLATLIDVENRDAIAQGYADAAERKYDSLGLSGQIVDRTLDAVEAQASVYKSYEALVADHAAKKLGVPSTLSTEKDGITWKTSTHLLPSSREAHTGGVRSAWPRLHKAVLTAARSCQWQARSYRWQPSRSNRNLDWRLRSARCLLLRRI